MIKLLVGIMCMSLVMCSIVSYASDNPQKEKANDLTVSGYEMTELAATSYEFVPTEIMNIVTLEIKLNKKPIEKGSMIATAYLKIPKPDILRLPNHRLCTYSSNKESITKEFKNRFKDGFYLRDKE